jgi:phosphatidylserine synthase
MFDSRLRPLIDPPLNLLGRRLAAFGVSANMVTLAGLIAGMLAALAIVLEQFEVAIALALLSRLADGLDGAVARATRLTDFGGYFDLFADYVFYAAVPLAFIVLDPVGNGVAGGFLIAAFYVNGASFLGYAALAAKAGMTTRAQGRKSLYFSEGILEGAETIAFFVLICLLPSAFAPLAWGFGALCLLTAVLRVRRAAQVFGPREP